MPYHIRITTRLSQGEGLVQLDLSKEQLEQYFVAPFLEGSSLLIGGKFVRPDEIERFRISYTDEDSVILLPGIRAERQRSRIMTYFSDDWYIASKGEDVTDRFLIHSTPEETGSVNDLNQAQEKITMNIQDSRNVFVVHGRNDKIREAIFSFLRSINLHPMEWAELAQATGLGAPFIGEILDKAFTLAQAVIVVMTPDDEACLREPYRSPTDPPHEINPTPQARPNVLFEAGMAMGRNPDRTILVEVGILRPFSDVAGRHVIRLDNTSQKRQQLAQRLQTVGCDVNLSGTDWHTAGDFTL